MLYSRLNDAGTAFEPQRNVMQIGSALDGGGTVSADAEGNVYVAWQAAEVAGRGEAARRFWVTHSADDGKTFPKEHPATSEATGACGCCSTRIFADPRGEVLALYRAATGGTARDMFLLTSHDHAATFSGHSVDPWVLNTCPMSSEAFAASPSGPLASWETKGQVYFARVDSRTGRTGPVTAAPGPSTARKHSTLGVNNRGEILFAWTEGTGWQRGGALAWQIYGPDGQPLGRTKRMEGGIPAWGLPTVVALSDGSFLLVH